MISSVIEAKAATRGTGFPIGTATEKQLDEIDLNATSIQQ
jgi:hypothetical protein